MPYILSLILLLLLPPPHSTSCGRVPSTCGGKETALVSLWLASRNTQWCGLLASSESLQRYRSAGRTDPLRRQWHATHTSTANRVVNNRASRSFLLSAGGQNFSSFCACTWETGPDGTTYSSQRERVDMVCCCSFFCWQRAFVRWFVTHRVFVNLVGDPYPTVKNFPPRHESRKEPESPGMMDISSMALHLPALFQIVELLNMCVVWGGENWFPHWGMSRREIYTPHWSRQCRPVASWGVQIQTPPHHL